MGYTTYFNGEFTVTPTLKPEHKEYLERFARTRRMARNPSLAETLPDPTRKAVNLPIGEEGGYYVGEDDNAMGQTRDPSILNYNDSPKGQPSLWCQWTPSAGGTAIEWDEGEKFYEYTAWIQYLIDHFLEPWGYELNGDVFWEGEDSDDRGQIRITRNKVSIGYGHTSYEFT